MSEEKKILCENCKYFVASETETGKGLCHKTILPIHPPHNVPVDEYCQDATKKNKVDSQ